MRVCVCNRKQAESDLSESTSALYVISINTPGFRLADIPGNWEGRLNFHFDDVHPEDVEKVKNSEGKDFVVFTNEMADQVIRFVESIHENRDILIHCDAGISRSMAMGRFVSTFTPRELVILTPDMIDDRFSNIHVWNTLRRCWYERAERECWYERAEREAKGANAPEREEQG